MHSAWCQYQRANLQCLASESSPRQRLRFLLQAHGNGCKCRTAVHREQQQRARQQRRWTHLSGAVITEQASGSNFRDQFGPEVRLGPRSRWQLNFYLQRQTPAGDMSAVKKARSGAVGDGDAASGPPRNSRDTFRIRILQYLGRGRHMQAASVNSTWRRLYTSLYPRKETAISEMCRSLSLLEWASALSPRAVRTHKKLRYWTGLHGDLGAFQWAVKHCSYCAQPGNQVDEASACTGAAAGGHVALLRWAHEQRLYWTASACNAAALGGHLEALKYARANGCNWSFQTFGFAARGGHIAVLRWMHAQGLKWGHHATGEAAKHGQVAAWKWLVRHGCPWHGYSFEVLEQRADCERWALKHGYGNS
ncbi:hypothetical protein JKP88DRAFT_336834 [Tribonema minus]|uniref:Uncharacterized protein n=1 Tax=Tribonema minus TaxID=303371 RepID=A0A835YT09_9STRA|nr:hypothetical protein JKP88DRAFT_336834 [Tribonema minus]